MVFNSVTLSFSALAGPICLVNLAFMIMLYNKGSLNSLKNGLLFSLACSDFCVGSITIPFVVFSTVSENPSCKFPIASYLLTRLFSISAAIHLLAIVYERFLKIMYPFWFNMHEMTLLRSARIVQAIWFASVVISIIPLSWLYSESCDEQLEGPSEIDRYTVIYDYACMAFILVLLVLMVIAFARVYCVIRAHLSAIRAIAVPPNGSQAGDMTPDFDVSANEEMEEKNDILNAASQSTSPSPGVRSCEDSTTRTSSRAQSDPRILGRLNQKSRRYWFIKEARVIVRFAAMVFMFAFVWITYSVLSIMDGAGRPVANPHFQAVVSVMQFLTSLFNPIIMTINNRDFQSTWAHFSSCLYRVFGCCCRQSQPSLTSSRGDTVTEEREIPLICTNTV